MDADEMKQKTKKFGLDIIQLVESLPRTQTGKVIGNQLLRSGLSVGAHYRSAGRAPSHAEFVAKLGIAIAEADESLYWMEMLSEAGLLPLDELQPFMQEADKLIAGLAASAKTAGENLYRRTRPSRPIKPVR
jgi:four helix bundle protein